MSNEGNVMTQNSSGVEALEEVPATLEQWKDKAEQLWQILDDIDTYGDMYKPEHTNYFKAVCNKVELRHHILQSDGYKLINTKII